MDYMIGKMSVYLSFKKILQVFLIIKVFQKKIKSFLIILIKFF